MNDYQNRIRLIGCLAYYTLVVVSCMEIVYITVPNFELAEKIGKTLVTDNLVACVNLFEGVTSIYKWQEKLQKESEVVIIAKTLKNKVDDIIIKVGEIHPYDCPLIFSVSTSNINTPFLEWVESLIGGM